MPKKKTIPQAIESLGEKEFTFPDEMGACADLLWTLDQDRRKLNKKIEAIEAKQVKLREHIIKKLPKSKASGIAGRLGRVTINIKEVTQVKDWEAFYKFIYKNKSFDLLQKRIAEGAVNERLDNGEDVPGTDIFKLKVVSLTKA